MQAFLVSQERLAWRQGQLMVTSLRTEVDQIRSTCSANRVPPFEAPPIALLRRAPTLLTSWVMTGGVCASLHLRSCLSLWDTSVLQRVKHDRNNRHFRVSKPYPTSNLSLLRQHQAVVVLNGRQRSCDSDGNASAATTHPAWRPTLR